MPPVIVHPDLASPRIQELADRVRDQLYQRTDRLFAGLLVVQWVVAVGLAIWITPLTWTGGESQTHPHVWFALLLGLAVISLPVWMAVVYPSQVVTRHLLAAGQMLMGALLIHLTGGRLETHFHVFGSLAFLAMYRDWRVLVTASVVAALDPPCAKMLTHASRCRYCDCGETEEVTLSQDTTLQVEVAR